MVKVKIDDGTVRANDITLERIEILTDSSRPDKVEIYMLDDELSRVEGGEFDRTAFMEVVRKFYNANL